MRVPFVNLGRTVQRLRPEIDAAVARVLDSGRFLMGPEGEQFEREFAGRLGARHAVGCASGTDALELILRAAGIGRGDEVVTQANTCVPTVAAIARAGATPVLCDVERAAGTIAPESLDRAVSERTRAVIPVHLYGQIGDIDAVEQVARERGIAVVEDCAQAHGARAGHRAAGTMGMAGAFSFYPTKNLGAFGDGGAVVTDDPALAGRVRTLTNHGRSAGSHHRHDIVGRNSRLDALQAGVLSVKLQHLERWNERRRVASRRYRTGLRGTGCTPFQIREPATPVHYLEVLLVPDRDAVLRSLEARGIECGLHYPVPCHRQPPFERYARQPMPVTDELAARVLSVPMHPSLSEADVDFVCEALGDAVADDGGPLATAAAS